jgi:hypothetical protein
MQYFSVLEERPGRGGSQMFLNNISQCWKNVLAEEGLAKAAASNKEALDNLGKKKAVKMVC